jgi:hypothetical protein
MRPLLNKLAPAVLILGLSFGAASPAHAFCNDSFFFDQCGSQCISTLDGCCHSGNWYCPHKKCWKDANNYLFCCDGWAQGTSDGRCRGAGGIFDATSPVQ